MKATRLQQDLARVHETADRTASLDAVANRLAELRAAHATLQPATPDARARAGRAKTLLDAIDAALVQARAKRAEQRSKQSGEEF